MLGDLMLQSGVKRRAADVFTLRFGTRHSGTRALANVLCFNFRQRRHYREQYVVLKSEHLVQSIRNLELTGVGRPFINTLGARSPGGGAVRCSGALRAQSAASAVAGRAPLVPAPCFLACCPAGPPPSPSAPPRPPL